MASMDAVDAGGNSNPPSDGGGDSPRGDENTAAAASGLGSDDNGHQSAAEVEEWIDPFGVHKEKLSNPQRAAYGGMGAYRPVRNRNKKYRK